MSDIITRNGQGRGDRDAFYDELYNDYYGYDDRGGDISAKGVTSIILSAFCAITFASNITNVYHHISAEKLPKGVITSNNIKDINKNSIMIDNKFALEPVSAYYVKDEVHTGDYLVSEISSNDFVMRDIRPLVVGLNTPNNFQKVNDSPYEVNKSKGGSITYTNYIVHTKDHNIFNKKAAYLTADSFSVLAIIGLLYGNFSYRKRKQNINAI